MGVVFSPNQILGRTQPVGCTAVEITQRCNLDCTLCYLSEHSESVRDIPLEEVFARLDRIRSSYGAGTHVQITGGDPALRKHAELIAIVRHARNAGLYPALFTNGIAASRSLLSSLAAAGLCDVAFHVDTTQRRPGFATEAALHAVRDEYLARARGLPLNVIFNTTVHGANVHEVPDLVRYFVAHADQVGMASFQMQADTGRGEWGARPDSLSLGLVRSLVNTGSGSALPWEVIRVGHPLCHSYVPTLVFADRVVPVVEDVQLFGEFLRDFGQEAGSGPVPLRAVRNVPGWTVLRAWGLALARRPRWLLRGLRELSRILRRAGPGWLLHGVPPRKLSFFVHNFMDARHLDPERVEACSFMVMTHKGPVSMCAHNARRDEYILAPLAVRQRDGSVVNFEPLQARRNRQASASPDAVSP